MVLYQKLKTARALPISILLMSAFSFALLAISRLAVNLLTLKRLSNYFGTYRGNDCFSTCLSETQKKRARMIHKAIKVAAKNTPWCSNCLPQAMVAKTWCVIFKVPYVFYIGFRKDEREPSGFAAHAWVMAGPIALTGGNGFRQFHVTSTYSRNTPIR